MVTGECGSSMTRGRQSHDGGSTDWRLDAEENGGNQATGRVNVASVNSDSRLSSQSSPP
jgi:hypothetical protein